MPAHDPGQIAAELPRQVRRPRKETAGAPPAPAPLPELTVEPGERGTTGTDNMSGIISGVEYLPALQPPYGLRVYDQMRRSSAQVRASLWIVKAPILSSTPVIQAGDKDDPISVGIADFCRAALFSPRAMRISWRQVLDHLLTRLDFGVSVAEKVWRYDAPSGTWRLDKISPRLATTISGWKLNEQGHELAAVEQQALRPSAGAFTTPIPASKCLINTFQREGDNYWGVSLLRSAYMHWFYMTELYRIDMVRADRYGAGIPKAKFDTETAWNNTKVVTQVKRALKALRSHERAYLLEHPNVTFSVMGGPLNTEGGRLLDSVEHHATMIIQNVLATFLASKADGLSTSRTQTLADVFSSVIELIAAEDAEALTDQVVRDLCDLNFAMEGRPYPRLEFTNIAHDDLEAITTQYSRLVAVGGLAPTQDDERHFRTAYKLPERKDEDMADDPDDPPTPEGDDEGDPEPPVQEEAEVADDDPDTKDDARASIRAARRPEPLLAREPTPLERVLMRSPARRAERINAIAAALEQRLTAVRRTQAEQLLKVIVAKDARTWTAAFTDLRPDTFTIPEAKLAEKAITATQRVAFAYGRSTVRAELARQGLRLTVRARVADDCRILATAERPVRAAKKGGKKPQPARPDTPATAKAQLLTSAKVTAEALNDAWFGRVMEVAVRVRRTGAQGEDLAKAVWEALEGEISAGLRGRARAEVNEALGLGRGVEARIQEDEIDTVVQSAILDTNLCEECEKVDGEEMEYGSARMYELLPPYSKCEGNKGGGDACRCEQLYLLKDRTV